MIVEKEMFLGVDGKQVGMEMTECQMTPVGEYQGEHYLKFL